MKLQFPKLNDKKDFKPEKRRSHFLREKKNSWEMFRRISQASARNHMLKMSVYGSYVSKNKNMNKYSKMDLDNEVNAPIISFIGQEIKYAILEMKNECLQEIRRQSCGDLDLFKNNQIKNELGKGITNTLIADSNQPEGQTNKNHRRKYRKSITHVSLTRNNYKRRKLLNKKSTYRKSIYGSYIGSVNNSNVFSSKKSLTKSTLSNKKTLLRSTKRLDTKIAYERFRFYAKGGVIEDSFNENESDEEIEEDTFIINPETKLFFVYDMIVFFAALYSLIYLPSEITIESVCYNSNKNLRFYINYFVDILFIIDVIINFFVSFYSKKDKLMKKPVKVAYHYLKGWFFMDFLTAFPFNIFYFYYNKIKYNNICITYENNNVEYYLVMLKFLKSFKIFKMPLHKKNQFATFIIETASMNPFLSDKVYLGIQVLFAFFGLHIFACLHIFIGRNTYPGWIFANEFQNLSLSSLYMISFYYLIQTMTTVGYGDISSDSFVEIIFRIILLAVGIIFFSWLISNISNGINKKSYAAINYSNDCLLLEKIRLEHTDLPFKVYADIKHYLTHKHFQRYIYDKNLLINSLPYALRNNLIFSMFKDEIEKFTFFKKISNTNFITEVLYNFSSEIVKKNEILLTENEIIEEIIFVKDGRLSLELPIDMDTPEDSIKEYLSEQFSNFAFKFKTDEDFKFAESKISKHSISSLLEERRNSQLFQFRIDKKNITRYFEKEHELFYLKIYDIHLNEDYGGIYMYHGKRSPYRVKVKTKRAKLYKIKRDDFSDICESYKNIIKRIHKKEKQRLKKIKKGLIRSIDRFCIMNGIKIQDKPKENLKIIVGTSTISDNTEENITYDKLDEEIDKKSRKFSTKIKDSKISSIKMSKISQQRQLIEEKKKSISLFMKRATSINNYNNIREKKKSYHSVIRPSLGLGLNAARGFRPSYVEDLGIIGEEPLLHKERINKKIFSAINMEIEKTKKRYSQQVPNPFQRMIVSNVESNKTLKGIEFNNGYSESEISSKTIKIKNDLNSSRDSWPMTINSLPIALQNKIQNRIKNNNANKFQVAHISIEITNNKCNNNIQSNISNLNILNNNINSSINETNNTNNTNYNSNFRYSISKSERKNNINNNQNTINRKNIKKNLISIKRNKGKSYGKSYTYKRGRNKSMKQQNLLKLTLTKNNKGRMNSPKLYRNYDDKRSSEKDNRLQKNRLYNKILSVDDNLSSTSAESFEIKRSYRNINQITDGRYLKDKTFQRKTIKFIKEYDKKKENSNIQGIKTRLTANFNLKKLSNNKEEDKHNKNNENGFSDVKTKMSDAIFKKKKQNQIRKQLDKFNLNNNENEDKSYQSVSPTHKPNKKRTKKKNSLNNNIEDINNSTLKLNSFSINPDETLAKLNCSSNNEMFQMDNNELKSGNNIFQLNAINNSEFKKNK